MFSARKTISEPRSLMIACARHLVTSGDSVGRFVKIKVTVDSLYSSIEAPVE